MEDFFSKYPGLQGMDPAKMAFLSAFAGQAKPQNMNQAMPFLMAHMNQAKKQNLNFSNEEIRVIADILCQDLPDSEKAKVQRIMTMMGK